MFLACYFVWGLPLLFHKTLSLPVEYKPIRQSHFTRSFLFVHTHTQSWRSSTWGPRGLHTPISLACTGGASQPSKDPFLGPQGLRGSSKSHGKPCHRGTWLTLRDVPRVRPPDSSEKVFKNQTKVGKAKQAIGLRAGLPLALTVEHVGNTGRTPPPRPHACSPLVLRQSL